MGKILSIACLALFALASCNDDPGPERPKNSRIATPQTGSPSLSSSADDIAPYDPAINKFRNCPLDSFLLDNGIDSLSKKLYEGRKISLNEEAPLTLFPKFTKAQGALKVFYFRALTNSERSADGYYAEALGLFGKQYIENNTKEFISFFNDSLCFSEQDLQTWARITEGEFEISAEGEKKPAIAAYCKKLKLRGKGYSASEKQNLHRFCDVLKMIQAAGFE